MSDPATKVEIEDVLSSIRKLVSVDGRKPGPASGDDRLVLTSDLRIPPADMPSRSDDILVLGASDEPAEAGTDTACSDKSRSDGSSFADPEPETGTEDAADPVLHDAMSLERRIAELEAAVTTQFRDFEPDGSEDAAQHRPTAVPFSIRAGTDEARAEGEETADTPADRSDFDAQVHELMREATEMQAHPAEAPDDPLASLADAQEEDDEDDLEVLDAESVHHDGFPRPGGAGDLADTTEDVIDEAALRDLVAEIVREELQGALGERITRNVRKLVRREIMRAVTTRDFE